MPDDIVIRIAGFEPSAWSHDARVLSLQASAGGSRRLVRVNLPFEAYASLGPDDPERHMRMMLQYALPGIELGFRGGLYSCDNSEPLDVVIGLHEIDALQASGADVMCQWMRSGASGPECTVAESRATTTTEACRACDVADDRVRCSDFVHPTTEITSEISFARALAGSYCNSGEGTSGSSCNPFLGTQSCWKRRLRVERTAGEPPTDISDRVVDEIDFFAVAYGLATSQKKPWPIPQARTTAAFFGHCQDYKDFLLRSAAVADLLDKLEVPDDWGKKGDGNLTRFAALIAATCPVVSDDAERLRSIHALRNLHPIHSHSKETAAFARLGIRYPSENWDLAWRQVLALLHDALRNLRRAV